jgi:hypothetical protein
MAREGSIGYNITISSGNAKEWTSASYEGEVLGEETSAATIAFGQLVYRNAEGKWDLANASTEGANSTSMLGICLVAANAEEPTKIMCQGYVQIPASYSTSNGVGEPMFMSTTAGSIINAQPSASGNVVRIVGYSLWTQATQSNGFFVLYFSPDNTWLGL